MKPPMSSFMKNILTTLTYEPKLDGPASGQTVELSRLDQRLTGLMQNEGGAQAAIMVRPGECSVWNGNPRQQPGLTPESCRSLIESIASEGGNRIPVLVRLNPSDPEKPYELLVGSRRRYAVDWLNHNGRPELRLSALVVDLSDEEAFRLADIENRERADITELDRARSYQSAVDRFYGGVQSRMAEALNLSNSQLSRLLALAQLPEEVVDAFSTKDELRVRHSEILTPLLRRPETRAAVIAQARLIGREQQDLAARGERMISPGVVIARLKEAALPRAGESAAKIPILAGETRLGTVKPGKDGELQVDLSIAADTDVEEALALLRAAIAAARAG